MTIRGTAELKKQKDLKFKSILERGQLKLNKIIEISSKFQ